MRDCVGEGDGDEGKDDGAEDWFDDVAADGVEDDIDGADSEDGIDADADADIEAKGDVLGVTFESRSVCNFEEDSRGRCAESTSMPSST